MIGALDEWAGELAREHLAADLARWEHVRGVATKARAIGNALGLDDRATLVAAAYLHDIGYAPSVRRTGFHALDGGQFLRGLGHHRVAGLVANHSGAVFEASVRELDHALRQFPDEHSDVRDMLWYCDLTTGGPTGADVSLSQRLADVTRSYGDEHIVTRSMTMALPILTEVVDRVEERINVRGRGISN